METIFIFFFGTLPLIAPLVWKSASNILQNQMALHQLFSTVKVFCAGVIDSCALLGTFRGDTLRSTSATDLFVIMSLKVDELYPTSPSLFLPVIPEKWNLVKT